MTLQGVWTKFTGLSLIPLARPSLALLMPSSSKNNLCKKNYQSLKLFCIGFTLHGKSLEIFIIMLNLAVQHCYNKKWNTSTANVSFLFLDISGKINYLLYLWLKIIRENVTVSLWKKDVQQAHVEYKNSQLSINISTGHSFAVVTFFSHYFSTVTLGRLSWELF